MEKIVILAILTVLTGCFSVDKKKEDNMNTDILYTMPEESEEHEGTWLQWPHHYQYGVKYRNSLDTTWVAMAKALVTSENVHIIAYNEKEKTRIINLLNDAEVPMANIDFYLYPTDDVWARDNGPIYVRDKKGNLVIQDWGFNGWGEKTDEVSGLPIGYSKCNAIPEKIGIAQNREVVDINKLMVNEGGSVEIDGSGALMACKSSIFNDNRNPGMSLEEVESIFTKYLGVTHFIWLEGQPGLELTDQHIDGFARFDNKHTIVTMNEEDLLEFDIQPKDIDKLYTAKNKMGETYDFVEVPLTKHNVKKTDGTNLGYKGSYVNYYIANTKVLVPNYNDPNDVVANKIIQSLYPNRTVVGIDVRNLYENGGMIHCVTQQQPKE
ncbi:agmatine deiminase family protein [Myroides marinus]|uniref:agmatine deiminase family protein n=1 Tax=Myroides marinus TaxID=703342 RepID=UPI0025764C41|nr:agmatine deiminase family protein [Myroides marinus]MDM1347896.1 agmatine deiminase family protein [Myroides marinus]MDM1355865.1 agmatine deiminase family protein [Myroides marinus]MDM1365807.1 agmatine deiminase family protein [Myroides marinus]